MHLIHTILKCWVVAQIFLLLPSDLSASTPVENNTQHHVYDFETADEEPTQSYQQKNDLTFSMCCADFIVSGMLVSEFYPSPYFELTAPPPEC